MSFQLYQKTSYQCSKLVTNCYSTSFSLGIKTLAQEYRAPVYAIYGFVRFADEIVDTFHNHEKDALLKKFKDETYDAINNKISLNPILYSFQDTVNKYNIKHEFIDAFLHSMWLDLDKRRYNDQLYKEYIYGSAEVVGLMCLQIFCNGDDKEFERLKPHARSLGAAFQKVNFLRDMQADYKTLGRTYFPNVNFEKFNQQAKTEIELDIARDFKHAYEGIKQLPIGSRFGVYMAYLYYLKLFKKIKKTRPEKIMNTRIRIPDLRKFLLLIGGYFRFKLNIL